VQVTAASVDGRLGGRTERCARALLDRGLVHLLASDAHARACARSGCAPRRTPSATTALAHWLTEDVPRAIVDGGPLPPRPEAKRRRLRFR
jgi:Capsular polysaccharide biosynthesis protein